MYLKRQNSGSLQPQPIRALSDRSIKLIAAGQVTSSLSGALNEVISNSLDACATAISMYFYGFMCHVNFIFYTIYSS